jgi:hypothetical protein
MTEPRDGQFIITPTRGRRLMRRGWNYSARLVHALREKASGMLARKFSICFEI